jgi:hypothetical protein
VLYYTDPLRRRGVCVEACPALPSIAAGALPEQRVCGYDGSGMASAPLTYAQQAAGAAASNASCVDAYDSVALAGYCVPAAVAAQAAYAAAGVDVDAEALANLRHELTSGARSFDAAVGDIA